MESLRFADLSPVPMADRLGITEATVRSWLAGGVGTTSRSSHGLARAGGVPFERLAGIEEP